MRSRTVGFCLVSICAVLSVGCGGGSSGSSATSSADLKPTGNITTFTSVAAMKAGTKFFIILDRPGGKISWPVFLSGTNNDSTGRTILFTIKNQPVGEGDSGSLVVDKKGNTVGALAFGWAGNDGLFGATSIEDEFTILSTTSTAPKKGAGKSAIVKGDGLSRVIRGVSPYLWNILSKDKRNPVTTSFVLDTSKKPANVTPLRVSASSPYSSTVFLVSSYGDAIDAYVYGTITTPYQNMYLCFGHPDNWSGGGLEIPAFSGTVTNFVVSPNGSFKLGFPNYSKPIGTMIADRRFGVVVDPSAVATTIPVDCTVTANSKPKTAFHGKVAKDPNNEAGLALTNMAQGISNILDAIDSTGNSTGTATFTFQDDSTATVDLTVSSSFFIVSDLYELLAEGLFSAETDPSVRLKSVTMDVTITTP